VNAPIASSHPNQTGNVRIKPSLSERLSSFCGLASNVDTSIKNTLVINWVESERSQFGKTKLKLRTVESTCWGNDRQTVTWT
jgi:hypothetical protein